MKRSGKIRVIKRDSSVEPFDTAKLRRCLWQAMQGHGGQFVQAHHLSQAIRTYLHLNRRQVVSSRALFEMAVRVLRQTNHDQAAEALEAHHRWRRTTRRRLIMVHETGQKSAWDRSWATEQIQRRWAISRGPARAISAEIECRMFARGGEVGRQAVLDCVDELVENYGLAPWCLMASVPTQ